MTQSSVVEKLRELRPDSAEIFRKKHYDENDFKGARDAALFFLDYSLGTSVRDKDLPLFEKSCQVYYQSLEYLCDLANE